jgi:hypothetical protein
VSDKAEKCHPIYYILAVVMIGLGCWNSTTLHYEDLKLMSVMSGIVCGFAMRAVGKGKL